MSKFRFNKLGFRLAIINGAVVLLLAISAYCSKERDASAVFLLPMWFDYPTSLLSSLIGYVLGNQTEIFFIGITLVFIIAGGIQWYFLGVGISKVFEKMQASRKQRRFFWFLAVILPPVMWIFLGGPLSGRPIIIFNPTTVFVGLALLFLAYSHAGKLSQPRD